MGERKAAALITDTVNKMRIILAYSGGPHSTHAIRWLTENHAAEVVTLTLDVGQGTELTAVRERALEAGALRAHVIEARDEMVRDYVLPALSAGALHEGAPPARALAQMLLARRLVDLARMEAATAVAHTSRGASTARSPLDVAIHALAPSLRVIAVPWPDSEPHVDANLWGRTIEWNQQATAAPYAITRAEVDCSEDPAFIEIEFDAGLPVRANGIEMPMLELIESIEIIAGAHGVGRVHSTNERSPIVEAPAAIVLYQALRHLEERVLSPDIVRTKAALARTYAELLVNGTWYSPAREALDAYLHALRPALTGSVRVELLKGACRVVVPMEVS
jgi:argininosuccinate synthase